jgi:flagellar biosynthetic protein FliR
LITEILNPINVTTFLLLFIRIASFLSFIPFFNYQTIPMSVKAAFSMWLTFLMFSTVPKVSFEINIFNIILAVLNEVVFAFFVGVVLQIIFDILKFVGEQISFVMGLTMANIMDPNFGVQTTIISQFITWIAVLIFLAIGGDHLEIMFLAKTLSIPFGAFFNFEPFYNYLIHFMYKYFLIGISLAFPVLAISLMSDIIFGMIMKTMPQFNLLVVGFPIKIFLSFLILFSILASMMSVFSKEILKAFDFLDSL